MRAGRFSILLLVLVSLAALYGVARAGEPDNESKEDSVAVDRFKPTLKSFVTSGVIDISIGSSMSTVVDPGGGWTLTNTIDYKNKTYMARDMEEINTGLYNTAVKSKPGVFALNFDVGETYSKKQTLGLARFGKDLVIEDEKAGFGLMLFEPFPGATSSSISFRGNASRGLKDFKYDKMISGAVSAQMVYVPHELFRMSGGAGTFRKRETSEVGTLDFGRMPSYADTFRVALEYGEEENRLVEFEYKRMDGVDRRVMPPRGNSLEILDDPSKAQKEEARISAESINIKSAIQPFSFLDFGVTFDHSRHDQENKVDTRLSKLGEETKIRAVTDYRYAESGKASISVGVANIVTDYGPASLSSYTEKEYSLNMNIRQRITDSLSTYFRGSTSLKQIFFEKREANPRDSDQLHHRGEVGMSAAPFARFSTDVSFTADRFETINIDRTLSGQNRVDYLYWVMPKITLQPAEWLRLTQDYSIKIEYTDFVHKEEENYLNRTTTLTTLADFRPMRGVRFNFTHRYLMSDNGSYLHPMGPDGRPDMGRERLYNPTGENLEYGLELQLMYQPDPGLGFWVRTEFNDKRNNRFAVDDNGRRVVIPVQEFSSGGIKMGFERVRDIGENGKLDLNVAYIRNYGPFLSKEKREYWDVDATLTFKF